MRFIKTEIEEPKTGDFRKRTTFLLLPVRIDSETRWLEKAILEEVLLLDGWTPISFVNE